MKAWIALTLIVLLAPMAAAQDTKGSVLYMHWRCTSDAARSLARTDVLEAPKVLAIQALDTCQPEEKALADFLGPHAIEVLREKRLPGLLDAIERARRHLPRQDELSDEDRFRRAVVQFYAPGTRAPDTGPVPGCAAVACGMTPTWDDRLKIWRPYRR